MIFANETCDITILNFISGYDAEDGNDKWIAKEISGCSWVDYEAVSQADTDAEKSKTATIRIPEQTDYICYKDLANGGQGFTLSVNDYIVKGKYTDSLENVLENIDKYDHIQIQSVKINKMSIFNHYKVNGI